MGILYIMVFVFITMIASFSLSQVYALPILFDDDYIVEKFATGLEYPTTMTFVGEDILVLEKNTGKVIRIQDNGIIHSVPVLDVPVFDFSCCQESGLLGITFASNHVYLYFTESLSGYDIANTDLENARNVVYQYDWNGENLTNPILIKELPALPAQHYGGVITTGLNNEIYFVIGEQDQRTTFQNIPVDAIYETGSIFKVNTESNNSVELFAMGIRNSFGLAVDPITGYLWETENGSHTYDEINLVKSGFNGGWISVMGPADRGDSDLSTLNPKPFENFVYSDPEFSWYDTVAPTGIAFPDRGSFGKYSDSLFVGDFNNGRIYNFQLNSDRTGFVFSTPELSDLVADDNDEIDEILFAKGFQGITDIEFHDGAMYVVVLGDGSIYKIYQSLSPLKQYQNGVTHKNIVCKAELMPIMNKSGYIYCVYPKTALTLIDVLNWSIDHPEMPKIDLSGQDLSGLNLEYFDLSNSRFSWSNFNDANISNVNFTNANLSHTDLSDMDLTGTILTGADLSNSILTGVDLSGTTFIGADLSNANLTGADLSDKDLTGAIFTGAVYCDECEDLTGTTLTGADLSGANLSGASFVEVDLTKIKNKSLVGADLSRTSFAWSNLSGVNLAGTILHTTNFWNANLSGQDFTVIDVITDGLTFADVNLSNSNFEGVDLSPKEQYFQVFKNKAHLVSGITQSSEVESIILKEFFSYQHILMVSAEVRGNDLVVNYIFFNSFANANLENANFKNADLRRVNFYSANLANADLSGADLRKAFLGNADLSNVNLEGADLTDTIINTNTILKCIGHSICLNE